MTAIRTPSWKRQYASYSPAARRIDAAIAFVTARGCDLLRHLIALPTAPKTRFVASVRFPTNLQGLADIAGKFPGRVWIHTGYKEPHEAAAERGQFHSKLVVADLDGDERLVIVGSHNWTENALRGHNLGSGDDSHADA